jgi:hypothetical protein
MRNLGTVPISENELDIGPGGDRSPSQPDMCQISAVA